MKHWIRDLPVTFATATRGQGKMDYVMFHFLRNAGWDWIWECDGYAGDVPNRVPDGNMELAGIVNWTPVGTASVTKSMSQVRSGEQSLEVDSQVVGDGVESAAFTSMENSKDYQIAIWAMNNTGQPWLVQIDDGSGSYVSIGSILHSGASFALTHLSFTSAVSGSRKIKIVDNAGTVGTLYISDILVFKSYFEYNPLDAWESGADGSTINPNQFSSGSYSFVAGDIGKIICVWDTTNFGNSGAYAITGVAAGVATLDLRSGGAALVAQSNLSWRMISLTAAPDNAAGGDTGQRGAGFGLEAPHASKWRLFVRQVQYGPTNPYVDMIGIWGAPEDTDFDFSTGAFYKTGPSTQKDRGATYTLPLVATGPWTGMHCCISGTELAGTKRFFLMVDDDGSFLTTVFWDASGGGGANYGHDSFLVGYLGADTYHPDVQEWSLFARWENWYSTTYRAGIEFDGGGYRFSGDGTVIGPIGFTERALWAQYGYSSSTAAVVTQTNAGPNRWSSNEWVHKPIIVRDSLGITGYPSEREADVGVYQTRQNMVDLSTFDSNSFIHFTKGLVWEWSGVPLLP